MGYAYKLSVYYLIDKYTGDYEAVKASQTNFATLLPFCTHLRSLTLSWIAPFEVPLEPGLINSLSSLSSTLTSLKLSEFDAYALARLLEVVPNLHQLERLELNLTPSRITTEAAASLSRETLPVELPCLKTLELGLHATIPWLLASKFLAFIKRIALNRLTLHIGAGVTTSPGVLNFVTDLLEQNGGTLTELTLDDRQTCMGSGVRSSDMPILVPLRPCPLLQHLTLEGVLFESTLFRTLQCSALENLVVDGHDSMTANQLITALESPDRPFTIRNVTVCGLSSNCSRGFALGKSARWMPEEVASLEAVPKLRVQWSGAFQDASTGARMVARTFRGAGQTQSCMGSS